MKPPKKWACRYSGTPTDDPYDRWARKHGVWIILLIVAVPIVGYYLSGL